MFRVRPRRLAVLLLMVTAAALATEAGAAPARVAAGCGPGHPHPSLWRPVTRMDGLRSFFGATVSGGRIYVVGDPLFIASNAERYDPGTDRWTELPDLPVWAAGTSVQAAADGTIFVLGAGAGAGVFSFDPRTGIWKHQPSLGSRHGGAAAARTGGRIYAIGGYDGSHATGVVEVYDARARTWRRVAPLPTPRSGLAAAVAPDGRIYTFGGVTDGNAPSAAVEVYDPSTDTWHAAAPLPVARGWAAAALGSGGRLFVVGGGTRRVDVYDPASDRWSGGPPLPEALDGQALARLGAGRIYAMGGYTPDGCDTAGVLVLDTRTV